MFCIKCGSQLPDNSKFCTTCGAQMAPATPVSAAPVAAAPVAVAAAPVAAAPVPVAAAPVAAAPVAAAFPTRAAAPKIPVAFNAPLTIGAVTLDRNTILAMVGPLLSIIACFLPWVKLDSATVGMANNLGGYASAFGYNAGPAFQESYSLIDFTNYSKSLSAYGYNEANALCTFILVMAIAAIALGVISMVHTYQGKSSIINRISPIVFVVVAIVPFTIFSAADDMSAQILPVILMIAGAVMALIFSRKTA